jgi:nicotinate-nucleotide pyrophosphorylase (carboxylating)
MSKDYYQIEWDATLEDDLRQLVRLAVREDLDREYDWTTVALVGPDVRGKATIVTRQDGILAGMRCLPVVIDEMQADIQFDARASDGQAVLANTVVAELVGSARDILTCERPLLNFLAHLSGIATLTREYARQIEGTKARIFDTRKTTPGWRRLEKYAVRCGGGVNHRTGLFDAILIKDNHLALAGEAGLSPTEAVCRAREFLAHFSAEFTNKNLLVEIEIERLEQLEDVLVAGPDIVLLDNMPPDQLRQAVSRRNNVRPQVELEASGGISLENVRQIALTGVERISVGALTHSAPWLNVALDWTPSTGR